MASVRVQRVLLALGCLVLDGFRASRASLKFIGRSGFQGVLLLFVYLIVELVWFVCLF